MNSIVDHYVVYNDAVVIRASIRKSYNGSVYYEWQYHVYIYLNYRNPHEDGHRTYFLGDNSIYETYIPITEDLDICKYVNDLLDKFVEDEDDFVRIRESDGSKVHKSYIMYNLGDGEKDYFYEIAERRYISGNTPYDTYEVLSIDESGIHDLFYEPEKFKVNYDVKKIGLEFVYAEHIDLNTKEIIQVHLTNEEDE